MTTAATRARTGSGHLELRAGTWFLRQSETFRDETGATRRRQSRMRVGPASKLRTRAQARDLVRAWRARRDPETLRPGPEVSFVEYAELFLSRHAALFRPTSRRKYRGVLRNHLIPALSSLPLGEIDTGCVQQVIADAAPRMAAATAASLRTVLLHVLRQAVRDGFGAHRIDSREVRAPKSSRAGRARRWITADELDRILAASSWPWRALWAAMGHAGLRIGEALGLSWPDVDFERGLLHVRQSAVEGRLAAPKTATSQASVPMLPQLAAILREYRPLWTANAAGLLIATRTGRPYRADAVRARVWHPLLADLGLPYAVPHSFRHGVPARLSAAGIGNATITRFMRHGDSKMTERYTHVDDAMLAAQLNAAASRMSPAPQHNCPQPGPVSAHESPAAAENAAGDKRDAPRRSPITSEEKPS